MPVAILGDGQRTLPADWIKEVAVAVAVETWLDASAGTGRQCSLSFAWTGRDLVVNVPPGSRGRETSFSLLGNHTVAVSPGDGAELGIRTSEAFSDVRITDERG